MTIFIEILLLTATCTQNSKLSFSKMFMKRENIANIDYVNKYMYINLYNLSIIYKLV